MTEKVRGPWLKFVDEFAAEGADKSWLSDCAAVLARAVRPDPAEMRAVMRGDTGPTFVESHAAPRAPKADSDEVIVKASRLYSGVFVLIMTRNFNSQG